MRVSRDHLVKIEIKNVMLVQLHIIIACVVFDILIEFFDITKILYIIILAKWHSHIFRNFIIH